MLVFRPEDEKENSAAYVAVLDNVKVGRCEFSYTDYQMDYTLIDCDDDILTEGLLRSSMNYCGNRGVYVAAIEKNMLSPAARRLGFCEDDLRVDIPEALTKTECRCG